MSNIIDKIQVSGVTYDIQGSGGGGITSGEVQTMIDQSISGKQDTLIAGTNITIDSANTISTSGLVTVENNDVEPYSVEIANIYEEAYITLNLTSYNNCADMMQFYWYGTSEDQTNNLTITNESGETKNGYWWWDSYNNNKVVLSTGLTEDGNATLDEYVITTGETPQTHTCYLKVSTHNGWRIKSASSYNMTGYDKGVRMILYQDKFEGGQSSYVIENVIEPELVRLDGSLSAKTDTSAFTAYTAATDTALAGKQTTLTAGTGISIVDNVISATGGGGNPTVELTQAEYDALVTAGTVSADTYYIITDAQAGDLTNYYTKTETNTLLGGKQATLVSGTNIKTINNESILGSGNIDIQGGSTYTAGRGISIANDTISVSLPISAGTGTNSVIEGNGTIASGFSSHAEGSYSTARGSYSHAEGFGANAKGTSSHAEGGGTIADGSYSHAEGDTTTAKGNYSHTEGLNTIANNLVEHASGQYNNSVSASTTFGNSGNTLFSVGNGTADNARHNAFEIRQNGDIYCSDGTNDVKLQDTITATAANTTALGGLKLVKLTQSAYDALSPNYDSNTLYIIKD